MRSETETESETGIPEGWRVGPPEENLEIKPVPSTSKIEVDGNSLPQLIEKLRYLLAQLTEKLHQNK